ncbi:MAG: outer membrane protein assembly factor BamD [Myxococcales bacterium]
MTGHRLKILVLVGLLAGCAGASAEIAGDVSYAGDPKQDYSLGKQALEDGRHLEALKYFEHVRSKYPYSTQAALADLAIGDTHFDREKYAEAVDAYRNFIKLHPSHELTDYAQFRIGLSHFKDMPSDFILFPPPTQKDQAPVRRALGSLEEFLRIYPKSQYAKEAQEKVDELRRRMARHELYVAEFYLKRKHHRAVVNRLEYLLEQYPGLGFEGEALLQIARSYAAIDEKDKAKAALERLLKEFPKDPNRVEAETLLKSLG